MIGSSIVSSPEDGLDKLAKHARGVLILLAVLQLAGGTIYYIAGGLTDTLALASVLGLGVVFGVLAIWARKDPFTAVLVGLGIWIAVHLVEAIIEPSNLFNGLVIKAIVIVSFINGVSTGMEYNKLKKMMAKKP